jgi:hypothetical protein
VVVRLVKDAVRAERSEEKNPVVEVLLVEKSAVAVTAEAEALVSTV